MRNRIVTTLTMAAAIVASTWLLAGPASAAGTAPRGAQVAGDGWGLHQGEAYAAAQQDARSKCASDQVVQRVSQKFTVVAPGWAADVVLVCG